MTKQIKNKYLFADSSKFYRIYNFFFINNNNNNYKRLLSKPRKINIILFYYCQVIHLINQGFNDFVSV